MTNNLPDLIKRIETLERAVFAKNTKVLAPSLSAEDYKGPRGGISRLVDEGFFATQKSLPEVRQKLIEYEYVYRTQSIANALDRLSRPGAPLVLLRMGGKKVYGRRK